MAPSGNLHSALKPDSNDAVVGHDDKAFGDHLVASHRDEASPSEHDRASRPMPRPLDDDGDLFGLRLPRLGLLLVLVLTSLVGLEGRKGHGFEREAEEAGADRPGDRLAAIGPCGVVGTDVGELLDRD